MTTTGEASHKRAQNVRCQGGKQTEAQKPAEELVLEARGEVGKECEGASGSGESLSLNPGAAYLGRGIIYDVCMLVPSLFSACVCVVAQSCLTLCDPMDCSPPGSSVHGARILEGVAMPSSRGAS